MIVDLVSAAQQQDWERARQLLYQHWITECPKMYGPHPDHPWDGPIDEHAIHTALFTPLTGALCADSSVTEYNLAPLNEQAGINPESSKAGQICGHVFKSGELTYTCRDCATDGTCVMCHNCFQKSIHKAHKYKIHTSTGSGYCDCGDADAWSTGYACNEHAADAESDAATPARLSVELDTRLRELLRVVLQYCNNLVCWGDRDTLPAFLESVSSVEAPSVAHPYMTVLYNDETHTYEAVIRALELCVHCNKEQAMLIATIVDREGRSAVKLGTKQECERIKGEIQRRTQRELNRRTEKQGPLDAKVMESALVSHQNHAISLMNWLNQQLEIFPLLSELVGNILINAPALPIPGSEDAMETDKVVESLLVRFLRWDRHMWKAARSNLHQMLMKTVLMNYTQKVQFAKTFLELYENIYSDFVSDDHELDVSIVSLSVQFLTVPSIARKLIAEDDAFRKVFEALFKHTNSYVKCTSEQVGFEDPRTFKFDFTSRSFPAVLKRAMHMIRDQVYMLNAIPQSPDQWSDDLRRNFTSGCEQLIEFIHHMQGMDEVKRQSMEHQVWELEWETAFNIQLRIQEMIGLVQQWASNDETIHRNLLLLCLNAMDAHPEKKFINGGTHTVVEVNGDSCPVSVFDVLHGSVSIHQPIWRLAAGLFAMPPHLLQFLIKDYPAEHRTDIENTIVEKIKSLGPTLYENPLRVLVLCAQTSAQLWRRNGFSLVNQIHNYYSPLCRTEMYDRDLQMLQVGAALNKPTNFILHLLNRFRLVQWADLSFSGRDRQGSPFGKLEPEETSKIMVALAEDLFQLFIQICGERFRPGIGKCTLAEHMRREIIHILCMGPHPFSQIDKKMPTDSAIEKLSLHDIVNEVADFRKPVATSAGTFHLKDGLLTEYNPFFYHYSKSDLSQAELCQQKLRSKMDKKFIACPPPIACDFEPFFLPVRELLRAGPMIRLCKAVLDRTAKHSRYASDRLLHRTLYLIGMGLQEQEKDSDFDYLTPANDEGLLDLLESLSGSKEVAMHNELLWWTIQKYKDIVRLSQTGTEREQSTENTGAVDDEKNAKEKRSAMAAKMRAQALMKMQKMQSSFMKVVAKETPAATVTSSNAGTPSTISRCDEDEDNVVMLPDSGFPVCLGINKSQLAPIEPRRITCMLCQEEEVLNPGSCKPYVCAAYVQKSTLFSQKDATDPSSRHVGYVRGDFVPASLRVGIDASTCSHTMHHECYQLLCESLLHRERQRPRQQMVFNQKMVDPELGEYLCPLCKRLSNAAMPVLPSLQLMGVNGFSSARSTVEEDFGSWVSRVKELLEAPPAPTHKPVKSHSRKRSHSERSLLDLAKQADDLSSMALDNTLSTSVPSASAMSLLIGESALGSTSRTTSQANTERLGNSTMEMANEGFDEQQRLMQQLDAILGTAPVSPASPSVSQDDARREKRELSRNFCLPQSLAGLLRGVPGIGQLLGLAPKIISPSYEKYGTMIREFTKFLHKNRERRASPDKFEDNMRGYTCALATWHSTAHVMRAMTAVLANEGKPLFGALNTRQRDCILAMSRLSGCVSFSMQNIPEHLSLILGALLCPPPPLVTFCPTSPKSPDYCGVTSPVHNFTPASPSPAPASSTSPGDDIKYLSSPFMQLFLSAHNKTSSPVAAVNLLNIDMLSLAISLSMSIGWSWQAGVQTLRSAGRKELLGERKEREMLPDGSIDEQHCVRLCLVAHYFQVVAAFSDDGMDTISDGVPDELSNRLQMLWSLARHNDGPLNDIKGLAVILREATLSFLRPISLLYNAVTSVPPPEALKDPSLDEFEPLCRYLGLPTHLSDLLACESIDRLFTMWSASIPCDPLSRTSLVRQPIRANQLVHLPEDFSDVIQMAAMFRCPTVPFEETATNVPTLCLICGTILCSQSYCCQKTVGKDTMGACRHHMLTSCGPMGVFLRIRDCSVVMMTSRQRGCFRPAPYVDEFGEADQGFKRGNPLLLNRALYHKICQLWLSQGITEEVVNQYEIDHRNIQYDWQHF